jgi:simple sugar transport system permease protein
MVAGKGFMAMAVCVFGNYSPVTVMLAALLFGAADALKYRLLPVLGGGYSQFLNMLPYAITILALCAFAKRSNKPASSGVAYRKE